MSSEIAEAVAAMIASRAEERELRQDAKDRAAERMKEFRRDKAERRKHGLIARHAAKLARNYEQGRLV